jgi:hypothetical protein
MVMAALTIAKSNLVGTVVEVLIQQQTCVMKSVEIPGESCMLVMMGMQSVEMAAPPLVWLKLATLAWAVDSQLEIFALRLVEMASTEETTNVMMAVQSTMMVVPKLAR